VGAGTRNLAKRGEYCNRISNVEYSVHTATGAELQQVNTFFQRLSFSTMESIVEEVSTSASNAAKTNAGASNGEHITNFGEFMEQIHGSLDKMVQESYKAPVSFKAALVEFAAAVNWNETWIQALVVFHVLNFLFFVLTRKILEIQSIQFIFIAITVYFSQNLNDILAQHWQSFSTQNYFDSRGVFTCTVLCAPLLIISFLQLINFVYQTSNLLIKFKRLQLRDKLSKDGIENSGTVNDEDGSNTAGLLARRSKRLKKM